MQLKCMDPNEIARLLEGHRDIITPLAEERESFYNSQECPNCQSTSFTRSTNSNIAFRGNDPIARFILDCQDCGCSFDPHSGLVLRIGNRAKLEPTIPILSGPED